MTRPRTFWLFAGPDARLLLGEQPERLLEGAATVKANPVRKVLRNGEFYLKLDSRPGRRLRREFRSAELVRKVGIPVVEHLGCARLPEGELLITRAMPGAVTVEEALNRLDSPEEETAKRFLDGFAGFVRQVLESGVFHPDFHIGNVLYSEESGRFALVDLRGVRKAGWFDRRFRRYRMRRIILEVRQVCSRRRMLELIGLCGIPDPEAFYRSGLRREAQALWKEWPKRKRQILSGYPKFTIRSGTRLIAAGTGGRTLDDNTLELVEGPAEKLEPVFLAHYFLRLARIAHREAAAFDPQSGRLWLAPVSSRATPCAPADFQERLAALDIPTEPADWIENERGIQIFIHLEQVARYI